MRLPFFFAYAWQGGDAGRVAGWQGGDAGRVARWRRMPGNILFFQYIPKVAYSHFRILAKCETMPSAALSHYWLVFLLFFRVRKPWRAGFWKTRAFSALRKPRDGSRAILVSSFRYLKKSGRLFYIPYRQKSKKWRRLVLYGECLDPKNRRASNKYQ